MSLTAPFVLDSDRDPDLSSPDHDNEGGGPEGELGGILRVAGVPAAVGAHEAQPGRQLHRWPP